MNKNRHYRSILTFDADFLLVFNFFFRYGQVITATLNDFVMSTFGGMQGGGGGGGWLSSLTSMVGGIFLTSDDTQPVVRGHRNRYIPYLKIIYLSVSLCRVPVG